jgi:hypothetical protein
MTDLPRLETQTRRRPPDPPIEAPRTANHWFIATITNADFILVIAFCLIGLLVTANVVLRFPDFGTLVEQLEQFP